MSKTDSLKLDPLDFRNHKVLKDGNYLILLLESNDERVVCKIARNDNSKLRREIDRILALKEHYPNLNKWMPNFLGDGIIKGGALDGKIFYLLEFISGPTLSKYLQDEKSLEKSTAKVISVFNNLMQHIDEHKYIDSAGGWFKGMLKSTLIEILDFPLLNSVASLRDISINGEVKDGLLTSIDKITSSKIFQIVDKECPSISGLGHWNFHGENIIINSSLADGVAIIDPDVSLVECDPLFGIARLLYSFPHDTMERGEYVIESNLLMPRNDFIDKNFNLSYTWGAHTLNNYSSLYGGLGSQIMPFMHKHQAFYGPSSKNLIYRLNLTFLLCLLRGVSVNYKQSFPLHYGDMRHFQNEALFLLLHAIDHADLMASHYV